MNEKIYKSLLLLALAVIVALALLPRCDKKEAANPNVQLLKDISLLQSTVSKLKSDKKKVDSIMAVQNANMSQIKKTEAKASKLAPVSKLLPKIKDISDSTKGFAVKGAEVEIDTSRYDSAERTETEREQLFNALRHEADSLLETIAAMRRLDANKDSVYFATISKLNASLDSVTKSVDKAVKQALWKGRKQGCIACGAVVEGLHLVAPK